MEWKEGPGCPSFLLSRDSRAGFGHGKTALVSLIRDLRRGREMGCMHGEVAHKRSVLFSFFDIIFLRGGVGVFAPLNHQLVLLFGRGCLSVRFSIIPRFSSITMR